MIVLEVLEMERIQIGDPVNLEKILTKAVLREFSPKKLKIICLVCLINSILKLHKKKLKKNLKQIKKKVYR